MATEIQGYCSDDDTYEVSFDEDVFEATLTKSGDEVESWLEETYRIHRRCSHKLIVGLDVEWRPSTSARRVNPVALLQISVDRRCLVFQILRADYVPDALSVFLADRRFTFVGVGIRDDAAKLRSGYGLEVPRAVDLRDLAADTLGKPDLRAAGLRKLVSEVLGVEMEKPHHVRVSDWDKRKLSKGQFKYACADAFASMQVGEKLYTATPATPKTQHYALGGYEITRATPATAKTQHYALSGHVVTRATPATAKTQHYALSGFLLK